MESKIEATRRLQIDGRWDEAAAAKDREKTRLVESGMTRRQAGPLAWEWMIENFPPMSAGEKAWRESVAQIPLDRLPSVVPLEVECVGYDINDYLWVLRYLLARDICIQQNEAAAAVEIEQRLLDEWTTKDQAVLATMAVADPVNFFLVSETRIETTFFKLLDAKTGSMVEIDILAYLYEAIREMMWRLEAFQSEDLSDVTMSGKYREMFAA
ncbi:hypothetical protein [Rosistilla oblonga]|uniref:hypothetical protein n=1 Tax=Rosistilla oblonga TaxID=2527990 RepID=UPI003A984B1F